MYTQGFSVHAYRVTSKVVRPQASKKPRRKEPLTGPGFVRKVYDGALVQRVSVNMTHMA